MSNAREKSQQTIPFAEENQPPARPDNALTVVCPYCHAPIDTPCRRREDGQPLAHFPAHTTRVRLARDTETTFTDRSTP